jgi:hypothetical protein
MPLIAAAIQIHVANVKLRSKHQPIPLEIVAQLAAPVESRLFVAKALISNRIKQSKAVVPPPPPPMCEWTGFYLGLHAGGQFGHRLFNSRAVTRSAHLMWQPLSVFASGNERVNHQIQNDRPLIAANEELEGLPARAVT